MLIRKKNRRVWIFRTMVNGKTWERSTGETDRRKAQARVPELKRLARLHRQQPECSLKLAAAIVREVARLEQDVSARQAERVSNGLRRFHEWAGDVALERVTDAALETYQRKRLAEVARSTVDKEVSYVRRLLRNNGIHVGRPSPKRGRSAEVRAFTREELGRFFEHCPERHRALFLLMLVTGARPAELIPSPRSSHVALLKSELDMERGMVTIRSAKILPGQTPKIRTIPVPAEIVGMLVRQAESTPGANLFRPNQSLKHLFDGVLAEAGIDKIDGLGRKLIAHSFRHTYATLMAEALGNNPFILKQALGHTQLATTDRYCHPETPAVIIDVSGFIRTNSDTEWGTSVRNIGGERRKKRRASDDGSPLKSMVGGQGLEPWTPGL